MSVHPSSNHGARAEAPVRPRVAVIGGGIAGLSCARELRLRGCEPVVFEAEARLGGRCSSRSTRAGLFDDGAQCITGDTRLAAHVEQTPGELSALHPWTVAVTPAEAERGSAGPQSLDDDEDAVRPLRLLGAVGVPSMQALAEALARPLHVRTCTPIGRAWRRRKSWVLSSAAGEIEEDFQALVLALPAPLAVPLAHESPALTQALRAVRYRSRWVLLLGSERRVALPGYREFQGSPIERVAAMHRKPGRPATVPERWFVEAGERWSVQHEGVDADTVAELLLANFRAHAGRPVVPSYLCAQQWRHAFVDTPVGASATGAGITTCLWDARVRLGVCGDSVVASQVDRVHHSGVEMARMVAEGLNRRDAGGAAGAADEADAAEQTLAQPLAAHP